MKTFSFLFAIFAASITSGFAADVCSLETVCNDLYSCRPAIFSGDEIALNTNRGGWMGCFSNSKPGCNANATCPGIYFDFSDEGSCIGERFQMYRETQDNSGAEPEPIIVGDRIGIYYPHQSRWVGCGDLCNKRTCPGQPTLEHGFESAEKWDSCVIEIFLIFAKGKSLGETVNHDDDIMIYNPFKKQWMSHAGGDYMHLSECPGQLDAASVPSDDTYKMCWGEVLTIIKNNN